MRTKILILKLVCFFVFICCIPSENSDFQPNILIIVIDTLRFDVTGLNNNSNGNMPFLKEYIKRGINFKNNYSTYDSTPPSHFSLLTGFITKFERLDDPIYSLPYQLNKIGYETFGISANSNLSQEAMNILNGFKFYICFPDTLGEMSAEKKLNLYEEEIDPHIKHYNGRINGFNRVLVYSSADRILSLVKKRLINSKQPFLGFVNLMDTHDPYFPDSNYYNKETSENKIRPERFDSDIRFRAPNSEILNPDNIQDKKRRQMVKQKIKEAQGRKWSVSFDLSPNALIVYKNRYEAEVRDIDRHLMDLFDYMKKINLLDKTIIIITSDHGEAFGEDYFITHSLGNNGDLEATRRVPLIFFLPQKYSFSPKEINDFTTIADISPTIYDLIGMNWLDIIRNSAGNYPIGNYGKSLLPYLLDSYSIHYSKKVSLDSINKIDDKRKKELEKNAKDRLRSLGYIK